MSKTLEENISTFSERIIKVLKDNGLVKRNGTVNFSEAERKCGMKGTVLQKAAKRDGGLYDDNLDKFLRTFHVKREWLLKGEGDIYDEKPTSDDKHSNNNENGLAAGAAAFREILETYTEYTLIPKSLLDNHRLISKEQMDRDERTLNKLLDWIEEQRIEIGNLRSQIAVVEKGQKNS